MAPTKTTSICQTEQQLGELECVYEDGKQLGRFGAPAEDSIAREVELLVVLVRNHLSCNIPKQQEPRRKSAANFLRKLSLSNITKRSRDKSQDMTDFSINWQDQLSSTLHKAKTVTEARRKYAGLCTIVHLKQLPGACRARSYDFHPMSTSKSLNPTRGEENGPWRALYILAKEVYEVEDQWAETSNNLEQTRIFGIRKVFLDIIKTVEQVAENMKSDPFDGSIQLALIDILAGIFKQFQKTRRNYANLTKEEAEGQLEAQRRVVEAIGLQLDDVKREQEFWHRKFEDRELMAGGRVETPLEGYDVASREKLNYANTLSILCDMHKIPVVSEGLQASLERKDGGSAQVQKVITPQNQMVAVKIPRPGLPSSMDWRICLRIIREASTWWKLRHANILEFHGIWKDLTSHAPIGLVSPWCDATLAGYVQDLPAHSDMQSKETILRRKLELLLDVAQGLQYLHSQEPVVIHADLKAANVLVHDDRAVLCDFGLSDPNDTKANVLTGVNYTVSWTAPEILRWRSFHTTQTDIYAFGCVFLEVITGRHPYCAEKSVDDVVMNIRLNKTPNNFPPFQPSDGQGIASQHGDFMKRCWSIAVEKRPSADELVEHLRKFVSAASMSS